MLGVIGLSFLAGVGGTGLGGLLSVFLGRTQKIQRITLLLTVGIMLSIVCFDLIPEAICTIDVLPLSIAVILGGLFVRFTEIVVNRIRKESKQENRGLMVAVAIALHNFPEGMIIGAGFGTGKGIAMTALIALHDVPEGIAAALPVLANGGSKTKGVLLSVLSGIPTVLGAIFGFTFASLSSVACAIIIAFAAGAMIYVIFSELIPGSIDLYHNEFSAIIVILGILIGLIITGLI